MFKKQRVELWAARRGDSIWFTTVKDSTYWNGHGAFMAHAGLGEIDRLPECLRSLKTGESKRVRLEVLK